jgi:ABC-2 type transport system permease protein
MIWRNVPAYLQLASMWPKMAVIYRLELMFNMVGLLLRVFLLSMVFRAVYAGRATVDGIALDQVITFVTLANLQNVLLSPMIADHIRERIRDGSVVYELGRPPSFLGQLLALQAGSTAALVPFVMLALPFAWLVGGIMPPPTLAAALLYVLSLVLGYIIGVLLSVLIGLAAFWTTEIGGFLMIYMFVNRFFGGALVPLWFFPPLLRRLAEALPFQAQTFIPLSLYSGQSAGVDAAGALVLQLGWVTLLAAVDWTVWRRAMRRVVVQGG